MSNDSPLPYELFAMLSLADARALAENPEIASFLLENRDQVFNLLRCEIPAHQERSVHATVTNLTSALFTIFSLHSIASREKRMDLLSSCVEAFFTIQKDPLALSFFDKTLEVHCSAADWSSAALPALVDGVFLERLTGVKSTADYESLLRRRGLFWIRALQTPPEQRAAVVESLTEVDDETLASRLSAVLNEMSTPSFAVLQTVLAAAAVASGSGAALQQTQSLLIQCAQGGFSRAVAEIALSGLADALNAVAQSEGEEAAAFVDSALGVLVSVLQSGHSDSGLQQIAVLGLGRYAAGLTSKNVDPELVRLLQGATLTGDPRVRDSALLALSSL